MYLVVGLGNLGKEFENTRHNLGFKVIEELASRFKIPSFTLKCHSFIAEVKMDDHRIILAQPQTFVNNSGPAVRGLIAWFKIDLKKLILVYDDVDLEIGQIRVREKGGSSGHHGVESIMQSLGTSEFMRVRLGIGRENLTADVTEYVLQAIPPSQREIIEEAIIRAAEAVEVIIKEGISSAMNKFNQPLEE